MDPKREMVRHALATVAYRGGKAVRGTPETFATFSAGESVRTPAQLLAHIGDLYDWALTLAKGDQKWNDSTPLAWALEIARFFQAVAAFDAYLGSDAPLAAPAEGLLQAPIADSLTHIGQLIMLRRLAGIPMRSENYFRAEIVAGRVGSNQTPPKREF